MKTIKFLSVIFVIAMQSIFTKAQVTPQNVTITDPRSYWQLSARIGYDFPMYDEDFTYIDYKGGIMAGASVNYYWDWFGIQGDFDYIKNSPKTNLDSPTPYLPGAAAIIPLDLTTTKEDITRMFLGVGPAFKHQSQDNKFTAELALLGGLGSVKGGEILVEGNNAATGIVPITYHSGFDDKVFTGKAMARFNYFFNDNFGVHLGAYYMRHFGVDESSENKILIDKGYSTAGAPPIYYYELASANVAGTNTFIPQNGVLVEEMRSYDLASLGVFAGITWKFPTKLKQQVKEEKTSCIACEKYALTVTARDKYSKELLPNTDVVVKNSKGEIVKSGTTNSFGAVTFDEIIPDNYTIEGKLHDVNLQSSSTKKSEFKANETLQKEILYTDKNFVITGKVFECNANKPLQNANVVLENKNINFKKSTISSNDGSFILHLPESGVYSIFAKKDNYFSQVEQINASDYNRSKSLFVKLEICAQPAECGKAIQLKNILYDLDKYFIREDAKSELNKLVQFMQDNPSIKVELGSHTDSRSSNTYNQTLSQNRANAAVDYIVSQGISRNRIVAKGYGETQLLNNCADGVQCSEAQHQINRRTEFKVICPQ